MSPGTLAPVPTTWPPFPLEQPTIQGVRGFHSMVAERWLGTADARVR